MANPTSVIDFSIPLATFLSTPVSDGTWADVIQTTKVDEPGQAAAATQIEVAAGQLWSNLADDFFLALYEINQGAKVYSTTTGDAIPAVLSTLASLASDGDAFSITAQVQGKTDNPAGGELLDSSLGGVFYRTGGSVFVLNPTSTVSRVGLTTATPALVISGTDVSIQVTGEAATNIRWTARTIEVREIAGP